jgi:anti-anti-sigma factor
MGGLADLRVTARCESGLTRVTVAGELDLSTTPQFERRLAAVRAEKESVRLDLSEVEFIDCVGLRAVRAALHDQGRGLARLDLDPRLSPQVRRLLNLLGGAETQIV